MSAGSVYFVVFPSEEEVTSAPFFNTGNGFTRYENVSKIFINLNKVFCMFYIKYKIFYDDILLWPVRKHCAIRQKNVFFSKFRNKTKILKEGRLINHIFHYQHLGWSLFFVRGIFVLKNKCPHIVQVMFLPNALAIIRAAYTKH